MPARAPPVPGPTTSRTPDHRPAPRPRRGAGPTRPRRPISGSRGPCSLRLVGVRGSPVRAAAVPRGRPAPARDRKTSTTTSAAWRTWTRTAAVTAVTSGAAAGPARMPWHPDRAAARQVPARSAGFLGGPLVHGRCGSPACSRRIAVTKLLERRGFGTVKRAVQDRADAVGSDGGFSDVQDCGSSLTPGSLITPEIDMSNGSAGTWPCPAGTSGSVDRRHTRGIAARIGGQQDTTLMGET